MGFNYFIMRPWFALSDWRRDWRRRKTRVAAAAAAAARDLLAAWWLHTWFPEEQRGEVGPWIDHFFSGGREIKRSVLLFLLFSRASSSNEHEDFVRRIPFSPKKKGFFDIFLTEEEGERKVIRTSTRVCACALYRSLINNSEQLI